MAIFGGTVYGTNEYLFTFRFVGRFVVFGCTVFGMAVVAGVAKVLTIAAHVGVNAFVSVAGSEAIVVPTGPLGRS